MVSTAEEAYDELTKTLEEEGRMEELPFEDESSGSFYIVLGEKEAINAMTNYREPANYIKKTAELLGDELDDYSDSDLANISEGLEEAYNHVKEYEELEEEITDDQGYWDDEKLFEMATEGEVVEKNVDGETKKKFKTGLHQFADEVYDKSQKAHIHMENLHGHLNNQEDLDMEKDLEELRTEYGEKWNNRLKEVMDQEIMQTLETISDDIVLAKSQIREYNRKIQDDV